MSADTMRRATTTVMSCRASVCLTGETDLDLLDRSLERLHELECLWSRFRAHSEITSLNNSAGLPVQVSEETIRLITAMVQAYHATSGAFDPSMLRPLVQRGYHRSRVNPADQTVLAPSSTAGGDVGSILVDSVNATVTMPIGTAIDPGGIGKGLAADVVADEAIAAGAMGALVEVGGDVRVRGVPPGSRAWTIATPGGAVTVADGGVATSSTLQRTWTHEGVPHHHLLDSRTQRPSTTATGCTVIAGTAAWAEALTKAAFSRDIPDAVQLFEECGVAAAIDHRSGRTTTNAWKAFAT